MDYAQFLDRKSQLGSNDGFAPIWMPDFLYDFQAHLVDWSLRSGRSAIWADCGLGKTPMQLAWAENVIRKTNKPVLILTPLAVSAQTEREAEKFGIESIRSRDGKPGKGITITNYQQLCKFNHDDFAGVVCDESSILKSFDGALRHDITQFMRKVPYRLLATATAAPNDYTEIGTSSEALGQLGYIDMLNMFFVNDRNNSAQRRTYGEAPEWRFKGHAELRFWQWVCSWARAMRKPSDLGYDDAKFILPSLTEVNHIVDAKSLPDGFLVELSAYGLREQRDETRRTINERCECAAKLVSDTGKPAIVWCHLNAEGDILEKIIPGAVQVSGHHDSDESKERKFLAFATGQSRVLVTKPKIGAWGLNFQHCSHVVYFPSHSYEQYYQSVRRCWRFGQINPVVVDVVMTEGERLVHENLRHKAAAADEMFDRLVSEMNHSMAVRRKYNASKSQEIPSWL